MNVDFGLAARDYARYRAGFPDAFFQRLSSFGIGAAGQRVLDLGTGTGTVARGLARRRCRVVGLDPSLDLMTQGRRLDREAGVAVRYLVSRAEQTGLAEGSFEVVTAGQCWHWFDRPAAAAEVRRVLVRGGRLVIAHFDWLPLPGNVVEATERLVEEHNPSWDLGGGDGFHTEWVSDVTAAGFANVETFSFSVSVPYSHEAWRGRVRACSGVGASLSGNRVGRFDTELKQLLAGQFPDEPLAIPHRVFAVVCRAP
jgi:SAM-dependent methyltransferase